MCRGRRRRRRGGAGGQAWRLLERGVESASGQHGEGVGAAQGGGSVDAGRVEMVGTGERRQAGNGEARVRVSRKSRRRGPQLAGASYAV